MGSAGDRVNISACLVTRGDVDMSPIRESLPFDDVILWDNSVQADLGVYGRYAAMQSAKHDLIYVQDDDCIVNVDALLAEYVDGERLCNMPAWKQAEYLDSSLLGWGAIFPAADADFALDKFRVEALNPYQRLGPDYWQEVDCIFTAICPFRRVDVGHKDFSYATAPHRMYHQPGHYTTRARVTQMALQVAAS
jgi:hypothetical protein